jgi:hypothetical protein
MSGLLTPASWAQTVAVAQVSGTVSDPSGAAVSGAAVRMTETGKRVVHTTVTDTLGQYLFPNLPIGPYRLEVQAAGFKDYIQNGLELTVGMHSENNVTLQVGSLNEKVEVTASAGLVETRETSVSSVVDQQRINELPLNNRQPTELILTLGGAVYADSGDTGSKTFWSATRIAVAGGQGNGTAYLLDGADATDAMSNVNMPLPFPDALQEFSIETSAVSSRFGTHPGATVNVVTKSGANDFHGDLFEYLRNGAMDARNFFSTTGADTLKRNQFGATVGGRIIRDKLFFFRRLSRDSQPIQSAAIDHAYSHPGDAERGFQHDRFRRLRKGHTACQSQRWSSFSRKPDTGLAFEPGGAGRDEVPAS